MGHRSIYTRPFKAGILQYGLVAIVTLVQQGSFAPTADQSVVELSATTQRMLRGNHAGRESQQLSLLGCVEFRQRQLARGR